MVGSGGVCGRKWSVWMVVWECVTGSGECVVGSGGVCGRKWSVWMVVGECVTGSG